MFVLHKNESGYILHKKNNIFFGFVVFLSIFALTIIIYIYISKAIFPIICEVGKRRATGAATSIISNAITEELKNSDTDYSKIIIFEKNENGDICGIKTDMKIINILRANICDNIYKGIFNIKKDDLSFPVGTIMSKGIFYGWGPYISVRIHSLGDVSADFEHQFLSAGINQTNHRIYARVKVEFSILMPFKCINQTVSTSICIAESVIVGNVPDAFTNVENFGGSENETIADEVVDFGAHIHLD